MFSHTITINQCLYNGIDQSTNTTLIYNIGLWLSMGWAVATKKSLHVIGAWKGVGRGKWSLSHKV